MEMAMSMGTFQSLNPQEEMEINGGGQVATALGITAATVMVAWAAPVGLIVGSGVATAALLMTGAGLFGKLTGLY